MIGMKTHDFIGVTLVRAAMARMGISRTLFGDVHGRSGPVEAVGVCWGCFSGRRPSAFLHAAFVQPLFFEAPNRHRETRLLLTAPSGPNEPPNIPGVACSGASASRAGRRPLY